jgi:signal peptidase I
MDEIATQQQTRLRRRASRRSGAWLFLRDLAIILLAAIVVSFLIKTFLVRSFYIPSSSMEETLHIDDRIIVNQLVPELVPIDYGDVVVFTDPGGWLNGTPPRQVDSFTGAVEWLLSLVGLAAPDSNDHLIKRVIGMPGDTVVCCTPTGQLTVNGLPLDEPYITIPEGQVNATRDPFEVVVPDGHLWVMGDNRYNSADSVYHFIRGDAGDGFVPIEDVVGRAVVISWPFDRWTVLDRYEATFSGVGEARESSGAR